MNRIKLLTAAAGLATAIGVASPAAAQYPYGYNNNNGANVVGSIINSVLGYGRYPYGNYGYGQQSYMGSQTAINQCAQATESRLSGYNRGGYNGGYNGGYQSGGYGMRGQGRVLGIDRVQVRGYGRIKVTGVATSGRNYNSPWGYGGYAYNRSYGVPDLRFSCTADMSGRIYDVNIRANGMRR